MNSQANTKITLRAVDRTSPGAKPKINQDSAARTSNSTLEKNGGYPSIYVVADGVGGLDKGEVASRLAVDAVMNVFSHGRGKREETSTVVDLPREATQATDFYPVSTHVLKPRIKPYSKKWKTPASEWHPHWAGWLFLRMVKQLSLILATRAFTAFDKGKFANFQLTK